MDIVAPVDAADLSEVHAALLGTLSFEATPKQLGANPVFVASVPRGAQVYLPALPSVSESSRVDAARELVGAGLRPVPHLAARRLASRAEASDRLVRWREAGIDTLLLIAGDPTTPAGPFRHSLDLLATGLLERAGFARVAIAGHPEGHPAADGVTLLAALREKAAYARATGTEMWIVTQFAFDAAPIAAFDARLRAEGLALPIRVGLPGPATPRTLMAYAWQCGVAVSARVLARRPEVARLAGRWRPDGLVDALAAHVAADRSSLIEGLHLFPFGGLGAALEWRGAASLSGSGEPTWSL